MALNIDMDNNSLDFALALTVGELFQLKENQMHQIIKEVSIAVKDWRTIATKLGISRAEQEEMSPAFRIITGLNR